MKPFIDEIRDRNPDLYSRAKIVSEKLFDYHDNSNIIRVMSAVDNCLLCFEKFRDISFDGYDLPGMRSSRFYNCTFRDVTVEGGIRDCAFKNCVLTGEVDYGIHNSTIYDCDFSSVDVWDFPWNEVYLIGTQKYNRARFTREPSIIEGKTRRALLFDNHALVGCQLRTFKQWLRFRPSDIRKMDARFAHIYDLVGDWNVDKDKLRYEINRRMKCI